MTVVLVLWSICRYSVLTPWRLGWLLRNLPNAPMPVLEITADLAADLGDVDCDVGWRAAQVPPEGRRVP